MICDFHCHVLPHMDDGSSSVEESVAMLRQEAEHGVRTVVATPHFYANHDSPTGFLERRAEAERQLREAMKGCEGLPQLEIAAEVC